MKQCASRLFAAALALSALAPQVAFAQEYPTRPIRVICPYGAGGFADIVARTAAHELSKTLGQSVYVENRTGAGVIARDLTTPTPISRGEFGAVAVSRILALLNKYAIRATRFIPGFTLETYPERFVDELPRFLSDLRPSHGPAA